MPPLVALLCCILLCRTYLLLMWRRQDQMALRSEDEPYLLILFLLRSGSHRLYGCRTRLRSEDRRLVAESALAELAEEGYFPRLPLHYLSEDRNGEAAFREIGLLAPPLPLDEGFPLRLAQLLAALVVLSHYQGPPKVGGFGGAGEGNHISIASFPAVLAHLQRFNIAAVLLQGLTEEDAYASKA